MGSTLAAHSRPDSVGFAAPVVDLKLFEVDAESGAGELLVRGPNVVKGYWNKPEATAQTFVDGWLHTGDLARIDTDGFVQIVDRKKDMINRGGENVYCVEVESALAAHPAVFEVAVVGVPDEMMGEKVGAVIVVRPGAKTHARHTGIRARAVGRFQSPGVLGDAAGAAGPQSRREGAEGALAEECGLGDARGLASNAPPEDLLNWYTLVHMPPLRQLLQIQEDGTLWRIPQTNPPTSEKP